MSVVFIWCNSDVYFNTLLCAGMNVFVVSRIRFFFQAEDGIRDLVRSRGLGDVYKRQIQEKGYRIEKLYYESLPGLYVPANLYIPDNITEPLSLIHI